MHVIFTFYFFSSISIRSKRVDVARSPLISVSQRHASRLSFVRTTVFKRDFRTEKTAQELLYGNVAACGLQVGGPREENIAQFFRASFSARVQKQRLVRTGGKSETQRRSRFEAIFRRRSEWIISFFFSVFRQFLDETRQNFARLTRGRHADTIVLCVSHE